MEIIVVAGKAKGTGKTSLIAKILANSSDKIGIIKTSVKKNIDELLVTDKPDIINKQETDTSIFTVKGAEKVVYLESDYESLQESFSQAQKLIGDVEKLIIEGNSILDFISPALLIYITQKKVIAKSSATRAEAKADIIFRFEDLTDLFQNNKSLREIPFKFNIDYISCFKAQLIARLLGIKLSVMGNKLDNQAVKVNSCQLGLF